MGGMPFGAAPDGVRRGEAPRPLSEKENRIREAFFEKANLLVSAMCKYESELLHMLDTPLRMSELLKIHGKELLNVGLKSDDAAKVLTFARKMAQCFQRPEPFQNKKGAGPGVLLARPNCVETLAQINVQEFLHVMQLFELQKNLYKELRRDPLYFYGM